MSQALISVVLPFRDASATLDEALCGLLAQTDHAREVLAIDDGSSDASAGVVSAWAQRDPRVRLLRTSGVGLVRALSLGVSAAQGELIARMDADDVAHPERLERQRAFLLAQPEVAALGTQVAPFTDAGTVGEGMQRYVAWQNALISPVDHKRELFVESPICHPSLMLRRQALLAAGGYQETRGPEDYELFLRLDELGCSLAKLPDVLLSWRHREGRATFADVRYSLASMRRAKAPYLAKRIQQMRKKRLVLWGAGPTGRRLARELELHGVQQDLFVDIDPDKVGRTARGRPIYGPDALDAARDLVIAAVGARGARSLIREALTARGFAEGQDALFAA